MQREYRLINVRKNTTGRGFALYFCDLQAGWTAPDGTYDPETESPGWSICNWKGEIYLAVPSHASVKQGAVVKDDNDKVMYIKEVFYAKGDGTSLTRSAEALRTTLNTLAQQVYAQSEAEHRGRSVAPAGANTKTEAAPKGALDDVELPF